MSWNERSEESALLAHESLATQTLRFAQGDMGIEAPEFPRKLPGATQTLRFAQGDMR